VSILTTAPSPPPQRLLLRDVSWQTYRTLGGLFVNRPGLRITFDRGSVELMVTSPEHEKYKKRLSRFLETLAEEFGLPLETAGNMTFQREDLDRGLEPDDCFWIAHESAVRGRTAWDPDRDPPPDLALEVEVSRSALNRLAIYAALRVPEVWWFDGETLRVELLQPDGTYRTADHSPTFPVVPVGEVGRFLELNDAADYLGTVRAFREWVRSLRAAEGKGEQP
jgi:Uma2 family endonuclease